MSIYKNLLNNKIFSGSTAYSDIEENSKSQNNSKQVLAADDAQVFFL